MTTLSQKFVNKFRKHAMNKLKPIVYKRVEKSLKGWRETMRKWYSVTYSKNKQYFERNLSYFGLGTQAFPFARSGALLSSINYKLLSVKISQKSFKVRYKLHIGAKRKGFDYAKYLNENSLKKWKGVGYIDKSYMYAERKIAKDVAQMKG